MPADLGDPSRDDRPEPSLELPSLLRRRKRATPEPASLPVSAPVERSEPTGFASDDAPGKARPVGRRVPLLPATVAAAVTGLVVGLAGTALTYGGLEGCQLARGTASCGGPGLLLLVAILAVMALLGTVLLAAFAVPDSRSTSVLAVGLLCVVAMVTLLEVVFSVWMFVVVPLLSAVAYLVAAWVTTRLVDELDDGPGVDVR